MRVKPKEVFVNLPTVLLFQTEDEIAQLASGFNTFLHGKVKMKYEVVGVLNEQYVGIFYLQRNDEFAQLREEFVTLIEAEEIASHLTITQNPDTNDKSCGCACHRLNLQRGCLDCTCGDEYEKT